MNDLEKLKKIASSATPRKWFSYLRTIQQENEPRLAGRVICTVNERRYFDAEEQDVKDAEFISTFDPEMVLRLIEEIETLRGSK